MAQKDEWGDYVVPITVEVMVAESMHEREGAEKIAKQLVEQLCEKSRGTKYDWGGRFAIVTDVRHPHIASVA